MSTWADRNPPIIEEFRKNQGKVGGNFAGAAMLLINTVGAKSGQSHTNPVMYLPDGDRWIIFATKAGGPTNPDWYHNLVANPNVTIEVGTEKFEAIAKVVAGNERDDLYARQAKLSERFAGYEEQTIRKIPVVALTRKGGD